MPKKTHKGTTYQSFGMDKKTQDHLKNLYQDTNLTKLNKPMEKTTNNNTTGMGWSPKPESNKPTLVIIAVTSLCLGIALGYIFQPAVPTAEQGADTAIKKLMIGQLQEMEEESLAIVAEQRGICR